MAAEEGSRKFRAPQPLLPGVREPGGSWQFFFQLRPTAQSWCVVALWRGRRTPGQSMAGILAQVFLPAILPSSVQKSVEKNEVYVECGALLASKLLHVKRVLCELKKVLYYLSAEQQQQQSVGHPFSYDPGLLWSF